MYIVTIREVRAVMAAPAFLPSRCRSGNEAPDGHYAGRPPILRIEHVTFTQHRVDRVRRGLEDSEGTRQPLSIAKQPDIAPHYPG